MLKWYLGVFTMEDIYELSIEKFDHDARGIGYINGIITFVNNTIPGDLVLVKLKKKKKKYFEADVLKFIKYSADRIKPVCPYFFSCGGCDLQYISYDKQLIYKENKVKEILLKFANINSDKINKILCLDFNQYNYRNKITLKVNKGIGLYAKNSYDLVCIDKCWIVSNEINNLIKTIKENVILDDIKQIIIRNSIYSNKLMVIFDGYNFDDNNFLKIGNIVDSIYVKNNLDYKLLYGSKFLEEKIGDYIFNISPDSFFQVNTYMCKELYDKIVEYGNFSLDDVVLDLYCGTGTIGIYISKYVKQVIGYEINRFAVNDAILNKQKNLVDNIDFYCGTSELFFENITIVPNVIIVDPPRSGLNEKTINGIVNVKPCKVIYVSCDPVTLARDLKILSSFYEVMEITPVDMFPNTKHVECCVVMNLKKD